MYTYIIESQGYHKIGRAENILTRMKSYDTHNPLYQIIKVYHGDYEEWLHVMFRNKHTHLEWYKLDQNDIDKLPELHMPIEVSMAQVQKECSIAVYTEKQIRELHKKQQEQKEIKNMLKAKINAMLMESGEGHPYGGRNGVVKNTFTGNVQPKRVVKREGIKREGIKIERKKTNK